MRVLITGITGFVGSHMVDYLLENVEDVESIIKEAIEYEGPSVIDARIDPAENVFPMVPSGGANGLFALTEEHLEEL